MKKLNLPPADLDIKENGEKRHEVFDPIRRKYVALTPEEWVRQHFCSLLTKHLGYPKGLIANEIAIRLNNTSRRCDTVVYDNEAKPVMIIEYKSPEVTINQQTFDQIVRYNMVLHSRYLIVSNGLNHYCCRIDYEKKSYEFLREIPPYSEL